MNQTFNSVLSQKLPTPNILEVLCGYGILILLFLIQFKIKSHIPERIFLNIWVITSLFLSYAPFGFARFYLRGLFFPLVILSIYSLEFLEIKHAKIKNFFIIALLLLVPVSSFYIFFKRIEEIPKINSWFYVKAKSADAIKSLPSSTLYSSNILADYNLSNLIPAISTNRVYLGHLIQTPDFNDKYNRMYLFYSGKMTQDEAKTFLSQNNINYIFYGEEEKNTAKNFDGLESKYPFLQKIIDDDFQIYQVNN
jgi:hypothetical protein